MDIGDTIDDFELPDQDGNPRRLGEFLEKGPVVLFFYPMAMTAGCTKESCHFRNLAAEFAELGAQRVGISKDKVEKQKQFAEKNTFDFPLLSDSAFTIADRLGARRSIKALGNRRITFVIAPDFSILGIIRSTFSMNVHADKALAILRSRSIGAPSVDS